MRRFQAVLALGVLLTILTVIPAPAQFPRIPDLEDVAGDVLKGKIPGLNKILKEDPAISTSFDDAVYGVPIIDGFMPTVTAPLAQLPPTGDGGSIVALPGAYELEAKSFCLHAGTHGPGQGEGYLWAPLKGAQAGVIQEILDRYMAHPELEQQKVQSLIWGIQSKAKINDMPRELRDVAESLLTRRQIRRLNGGALGMVPEELFDQAFVDVPDEVRMVLEAEARLRDRLRQEVYDFDALEDIAVLAGEPDREEGGPVIPRLRWSFEPGGFFVRFDPHGYSHTTVQLYAPEQFRALTDDLGRITSLVDRAGQTLELQYASADPTSVQGDVATWTLSSLRLTDSAGSAYDIACSAADTVMTGVADGSEAMAGIRELARHVDGASPDSPLADNVVNLAHVVDAVQAFAEREGAENRAIREIEAMGQRAVASELAMMLTGAESATAFRPVEETRLALLPWATGAVVDVGAGAWMQRGGGLPIFRPSGGTGTPANRGRQRLGISGGQRQLPTYRPPSRRDDDGDDDGDTRGGNDKSAVSNARNAIDGIQKGKDAIDIATDVRGWGAGKIGMGIPDYLFGKILDFNFDAWGEASKALGGDPPVPDYDEIAMPEPISLPEFAPTEEVSAEHTAAVNALADALSQNFALVRAANVTEDRLGGALEAGDDEWTSRQAVALVDYKRRAGMGFQQIAVAIDGVLAALRNAGVNQITVTPEAVRAYQQRLQADGWNAEELQAAQLLGIGEAELQEMLAERIAADPSEVAGDVMAAHTELADSLWWLGAIWRELPAADPGA
ncbi:MAG: hypothetical protein ACOCX2_04505 [Armatimonadota bacterium]